MKTTPGQFLKQVRKRLGMTLRDVQEASTVIAAGEGRHGFFISAAHMNRIEMDVHTPSALKLFTICAIYALDIQDVMRRYGVDATRLKLYRDRFLNNLTRLVSSEIYGTEEKVIVPIRLASMGMVLALHKSLRRSTLHNPARLINGIPLLISALKRPLNRWGYFAELSAGQPGFLLTH